MSFEREKRIATILRWIGAGLSLIAIIWIAYYYGWLSFFITLLITGNNLEKKYKKQ